MKLESPEFTDDDIAGFLTDYFEKERQLQIARLKKILEDTESLIPQLEGKNEPGGDAWNAIETLAHMATTAQFFGWLAHEVATKKDVEGDITEMLRLRDIVVTDASQLPPGVLMKELRDHVEKTIGFLETVDWDDLRTPVDYVGKKMTGEDFIRYPLSGHLEGHLEQMKEALGS
jgi:hypothetical protein